MQAVHPDEIAAYLEVYTYQIIKDLSALHIAIDGKKMRGTNPLGHGESRMTSYPSRPGARNVVCNPTTSRKSSDFDAIALV